MMNTLSETVQQIALSPGAAQKMELFNRLAEMDLKSGRDIKTLLPLLYEDDANIRKESAYLLESLGAELKGDDFLQYRFALQDFELFVLEYSDHPRGREILFNGLLDKNLRLRAKLLKYIHEKDCHSEQEIILYYYGRTDYEVLAELYFNAAEASRTFILELLHKGSRARNNVPYHCRQCALLLEKLLGAEELEAPIRELLEVKTKTRPDTALEINLEAIRELSGLDLFIDKLQSAGIWINNQLLFPKIQVGPATGRITYREPGLQTWPKEKRLSEIKPPDGYQIIRFDYRTIEPLILLNILLSKHLLSIQDIPEGDIYAALYAKDRSLAKRYLNSLINGGARLPEFNPGKFLWKLLPALDELRSELFDNYNHEGGVTTIGGRKIELDKKTANLSGKIMNRLIQGSAADFFNRAVLEIDDWIDTHHTDARVYFLIYDELWITAKPNAAEFIAGKAAEILNKQHCRYNFTLPVTVNY